MTEAAAVGRWEFVHERDVPTGLALADLIVTVSERSWKQAGTGRPVQISHHRQEWPKAVALAKREVVDVVRNHSLPSSTR